MDSSPDLSLKLRRGSSDSRDSFYMDFAQGIDSDIEEVDTTVHSSGPATTTATQGQTDTLDEGDEGAAGGDDDSPTIPLPPPPHMPSENG